MKEDKVNKAVSNFEEKYRAWLKSQQDQTSAYDYEKSFVEFMAQVGQDTLGITTSSDHKGRNSKKKSKPQLGNSK